MPIIYDETKRQFHIQAGNMSYCFDIVRDGWLRHSYWGRKIAALAGANEMPFMDRSFSANVYDDDRTFSLDTLAREYPAHGNTDFREPVIKISQEDGSVITDLRYKEHRIFAGKKKLTGLPAVYAVKNESTTLEIVLTDAKLNLEVVLSYSVIENLNVIMRSVRIVNHGQQKLVIKQAMSMACDLGNCADFEIISLPGAHCRERAVERHTLGHYRHVVESRRGASSNQQNPFLALASHHTNEDYGEVYALNLVYSGSFQAWAEVDQFDVTRMAIGINPFDFEWVLKPGESFQTPEAVMVYSANGLGEMSRTFHRLYQKHLCRGKWRDKVRPVLVNNWEATYFDFDEEKLISLIDKAHDLGIELMVLDDGWFGHRNDDTTSLGDWAVDKNKLPNGLKPIAEHAVSLGMMFGLWFEPEMISEDSDLYRAHPDWCLQVPGRHKSVGRNQLVLDLSRFEVQEYVVDSVCQVLKSAPISYVKWDMNRHMTEAGSLKLPADQQREVMHRYILGLYAIMEQITAEFPDVLFESCSGGGGRFDPGMLYYMPQTWASDDSDAVERLRIQYGTSLAYPDVTIGSHVSAIPNHQTGRQEPLATRGLVAMQGAFGYELDITNFSEAESLAVKQQIKDFKQLRPLLQFGDLYRLLVPEKAGDDSAWLLAAADGSEAWLTYVQVLARPNPGHRFIKLAGLDSKKKYRIECWQSSVTERFPGVPDSWPDKGPDGKVFGGDELMYAGITLPIMMGDYQSFGWYLKAVD